MQVFQAYRERRPGWAAVISIVFGPEIGMFYLGRGRLGLAYILLSLLVVWVLPLALQISVPFLAKAHPLILIAYRIAATVHVYRSAAGQAPRERHPWFARWYYWILVFWLAPLALALAIRTLIVQPFTIPANSMQPTLRAGDYMFADKMTLGYSRYSLPFDLGPQQRIGGRAAQRGDVVIFRLPSNPRTDFIKRVIGLPGDRIEMRHGRLYINDVVVSREEDSSTTLPDDVDGKLYRETLPGGHSYLIIELSDNSRGDNTNVFQVPDGHYFMMGDNRDNSLDSRYDVGFIPAENIYALATIVITNATDRSRFLQSVE